MLVFKKLFKNTSGGQGSLEFDENQVGLAKSQATISLHLNGSNTIDAIILSKTISDFAMLTQEVAKETDPSAFVKMDVKTFENGSFAIVFAAVCSIQEWVTTNPVQAAALATSIINGVKGVFEIAKFAKGEKPKEATYQKNGTVTVFNNYGDSINVLSPAYCAYEKPQTQQRVADIAEYAKKHDKDKGFTLSDEKETIHFTTSDIEDMKKTYAKVQSSTYRTYKTRETLFIKKPDILGHSAWEFKLDDMKDGKNITAKIEDETFLDNVSGGTTISTGAYIVANLETQYELNEEGIEIRGSEKYRVVEILQGITNPNEQLSL